jgi:hypothetical protein
VKLGDTIVWCPDKGIDHLYILISDPANNGGKCVPVNLTESLHCKYSFILKKGDHEFIYKDSDVNFGDAIETTIAKLEENIALGQATPHKPMKLDVLKRIVNEAHTHAAFPIFLRKLIPPRDTL